MKIAIGIVFGFFSGFLIYMASVMMFTGGEPSALFVFATFLGAWAVSTIVLVRGARTLSKVVSRGFLLGAAEWLAMIPVGMVVSGQALTDTVAQGNGGGAELVGAIIGAGLVSILTGGVSVAMAVVCLIGFAVSYFIGREMRPEETAPTRSCPECTEFVKEAARKCKHCGTAIPQAA